MKRNTPKRKVHTRGSLVVLVPKHAGTVPSFAQAKKLPILLTKTKTRRYIMYSLGCVLLSELVKFLVASYVFTGVVSPSGMVFLLIIYLQLALMLGIVGFAAAAAISYLYKSFQNKA